MIFGRRHSCLPVGSIILVVAFAACSTIDSYAYMRPEADGIDVVDTYWGPQVRFSYPRFTLQYGPVAMGSHRVSDGPCLLPVIPGREESPAPLQIEIHLHANSPTRIYPGNWSVYARAEEFGTFMGDDVYTRYNAVNAGFFDSPPQAYDQKNIGHWTAADNARNDAVLIESEAYGVIFFPVYDNEFIDFKMEAITVEIEGETVTVPAIDWSRHGNWKYDAFTLEPMMPDY